MGKNIKENIGEVKGFIVCGDTHGNHKLISHRVKSLKLVGETIFHVGDFGLGFRDEQVDIDNLIILNSTLKEFNTHLYVIRGNHDNPTFFTGNYNYSHLHLLPDYSIINVNGENVLLVGGAISVDREPRKSEMREMLKYNKIIETYWFDEKFVLDIDKLKKINNINYVITHSSPSFVFPFNNFNNKTNSHGAFVEQFVTYGDTTLKDDLNKERKGLSDMYDILNKNNNIKSWFYGHFHQHRVEEYKDTKFVLLNCDEFYNVIQ